MGDRACKGGVVAVHVYEWMASEQQLVCLACPCATSAHPYTIPQMGGKPEKDPNATLATHQPLFNRDTFPHFRIKARVAGARVGGGCIPAPCSRGQIPTISPLHLNLGLPGCPARQLLRLWALPLRLCRVLRQVPPAMCVGLRDAGCERDGASERARVCSTGSVHFGLVKSSSPPRRSCADIHIGEMRDMTIHHRKTNGDLFDGTPDCYPGGLLAGVGGGFLDAQRPLTAWPSKPGAKWVGSLVNAST